MFANNWDVRMALGERLPSGSVEPRIGITMSYQHFKAFVEALASQLNKLEEVMGGTSYVSVNPSALTGEE
jgi:hypothetical protein